MDLILASSSPYRADLLRRLNLPFRQVSPDIDETMHAGEHPRALVARLAREKARAVASTLGDASGPAGGPASGREGATVRLIIGSDQVLWANDEVLTKPGSTERAQHQLTSLSGSQARLLTGVALLNTDSGHMQFSVATTTLHFRCLSAAEIAHYVATEMPLDCAGAFKAEGLGISLFEQISGDDHTAIIGLPLIRLIDFLRNEGYNPLQPD